MLARRAVENTVATVDDQVEIRHSSVDKPSTNVDSRHTSVDDRNHHM
jgi:hypothetical protein